MYNVLQCKWVWLTRGTWWMVRQMQQSWRNLLQLVLHMASSERVSWLLGTWSTALCVQYSISLMWHTLCNLYIRIQKVLLTWMGHSFHSVLIYESIHGNLLIYCMIMQYSLTYIVAAQNTGTIEANSAKSIKSRNKKLVWADLVKDFWSGSRLYIKLIFFE